MSKRVANKKQARKQHARSAEKHTKHDAKYVRLRRVRRLTK